MTSFSLPPRPAATPCILTAILLVVGIVAPAVCSAQPNLARAELNRTATRLAGADLRSFPGAHFGFAWDDGDNATLRWRPQGIAGIGASGRNWIAVSWYGRSNEGYEDRGSRVSFVDITDLDDIRYRHVLLVDENGATFRDMHAGGLVYKDGNLHVPDSRRGQRKVHVFRTSAIEKVDAKNGPPFYNYAYVLRKQYSYDVPITPSFLSYDWDQDSALVGTFFLCEDDESHDDASACSTNERNRLAWFKIGEVGRTSGYCSPFFSEMQGAASGLDGSGKPVLWVAASYGRYNPSHLHAVSAASGGLCEGEWDRSRVIEYPPGLEDMHISRGGNIWMLTEFGSNEPRGGTNRRLVFATRKDRLLPTNN